MKKKLFHFLFLQLLWCLALFSFIHASGQSCQFQQGQNGGVGQSVVSPVQFERGNSNGAKSHFAEGYSVPYRVEFTRLEASQQYKVRISFDVKKNDKFAFDYITGFQNLGLNPSIPSELVDPLFGTSLASVGGISVFTLPIPSPNFSTSSLFNSTASSSFLQLKSASGLNPETTLPASSYSAAVRNKGNMAIWNGVINSIQYVGGVNMSSSTVSVSMDVVFTKANNANNVVLAWGGHIASLQDWGQGNSASAIPGSPYHMYVETVVNTSNNDVICNGNMDCQIASDAVTPAPICSITGPSRLCESSAIVDYKAMLDAAENGTVSYVWSLINLSSGTPPQLVGSGTGITSIDTITQSVIPSDSFLVRLRVYREGIYNYCYLNSTDSPGTKVKKIKIDVLAQASPTVISMNSSSTSQLNASIHLDGELTSAGFSYQWTILGPSGFAAGSLSNSTISNPVFTATMAGDYQLKVVVTQLDSPNCTDSTQVVISVLPTQSCPSLITQSICAASQLSAPVLSLPQTGVDYSWSVTNGASIISEGGDSLLSILSGSQDFEIQLQLSFTNPLLSNLTCTYPIIVHPIPIVSAGEISPTCETSMPISLGGVPAGGTWSGVGVSGTTFSPSVAGAGTHKIYYTYTDTYGCTGVDSTTVEVNAIPTLYPGSYGPLCVNASPIFLSATPGDGTWSGTGVAGNTFTPSEAGVGVHAITYQVPVVGGCVADTTIEIEVKPLPVLSLGAYGPLCVEGASITLAATPAGGTWSGVGVSGTTFSPSVAGAGIHTLTYYYTDIYGCTSVKETTVKVEVCLRTNACTYTQGYYGSTNGKSCDGDSIYRSATSLIKKLLTSGPIVIGSGARTLTISVTDSARLNAVMPGGGTPFTFSHTGNITLQSSQFSLYKTSKGKINNILLSQTITLALNVRIKDDLAPFELKNGYLHSQRKRSCVEGSGLVTCQEDPLAIKAWQMIPSVVNYLAANGTGTVNDLLALANAVLGRTKVPGQAGLSGTVVPSLGDIVAQIDVINNAFDQCRIFLGYFPTMNLCQITSLRMEAAAETQQEIAIKEMQLNVFPNPFESLVNFTIQTPIKTKVTIELFDMQGKLLQLRNVGEVMSQEKRQVELIINKNSAPLLYRVTTSQRVFSGILLPMH